MMSRVAPHPEELMGIAFLRIPSNAAGMIAECGEGIISRYPAQGKILTYQTTIIMSADADERTPGSLDYMLPASVCEMPYWRKR